jgi:hypothetical protein
MEVRGSTRIPQSPIDILGALVLMIATSRSFRKIRSLAFQHSTHVASRLFFELDAITAISKHIGTSLMAFVSCDMTMATVSFF